MPRGLGRGLPLDVVLHTRLGFLLQKVLPFSWGQMLAAADLSERLDHDLYGLTSSSLPNGLVLKRKLFLDVLKKENDRSLKEVVLEGIKRYIKNNFRAVPALPVSDIAIRLKKGCLSNDWQVSIFQIRLIHQR